MRWNPLEFGGVSKIFVSPEKLWLPDVVLFNKWAESQCGVIVDDLSTFSADGNYEVSYYSNVVVNHDGSMLWVPPAIYKSSCIIGLISQIFEILTR